MLFTFIVWILFILHLGIMTIGIDPNCSVERPDWLPPPSLPSALASLSVSGIQGRHSVEWTDKSFITFNQHLMAPPSTLLLSGYSLSHKIFSCTIMRFSLDEANANLWSNHKPLLLQLKKICFIEMFSLSDTQTTLFQSIYFM